MSVYWKDTDYNPNIHTLQWFKGMNLTNQCIYSIHIILIFSSSYIGKQYDPTKIINERTNSVVFVPFMINVVGQLINDSKSPKAELLNIAKCIRKWGGGLSNIIHIYPPWDSLIKKACVATPIHHEIWVKLIKRYPKYYPKSIRKNDKIQMLKSLLKYWKEEGRKGQYFGPYIIDKDQIEYQLAVEKSYGNDHIFESPTQILNAAIYCYQLEPIFIACNQSIPDIIRQKKQKEEEQKQKEQKQEQQKQQNTQKKKKQQQKGNQQKSKQKRRRRKRKNRNTSKMEVTKQNDHHTNSSIKECVQTSKYIKSPQTAPITQNNNTNYNNNQHMATKKSFNQNSNNNDDKQKQNDYHIFSQSHFNNKTVQKPCNQQHGSLFYQKLPYQFGQLQTIHNYFKSDLSCAPKVLFNDHSVDKDRAPHQNRMNWSGQSLLCGRYDQNFCYGITTQFNNTQNLINFKDFRHLMDKEFESLMYYIRDGGDIVCPAQNILNDEFLIKHNLGTNNLPTNYLLYIQQKLDEIQSIARHVFVLDIPGVGQFRDIDTESSVYLSNLFI